MISIEKIYNKIKTFQVLVWDISSTNGANWLPGRSQPGASLAFKPWVYTNAVPVQHYGHIGGVDALQ